MENTTVTNEFSFFLKPTEHGIGVFATHDIKEGTYLRMFGGEEGVKKRVLERKKNEVPERFRQYCAHRGKTMLCPSDFGMIAVGWYLNHSKSPNAFHKNYEWYAARDIAEGEEVLIDYNTLEEPEEAKEEYYKS